MSRSHASRSPERRIPRNAFLLLEQAAIWYDLKAAAGTDQSFLSCMALVPGDPGGICAVSLPESRMQQPCNPGAGASPPLRC